ncbi:uncharacterized protein LOC129230687 [Uloborus diversus]|uniref:uncharacterized protein LOC129230687 n=1 Tax=Uloborus diversus TaxID=327109 RepID=UPI0024093F59|nr:uncharacterized protein LOC129230687 [Uloborus diversus]
MYRRHLKMVLHRDVESNRFSKSEFMHRIASIPMVYLAWNIAAETYQNVKACHVIIKVSLDTTERAAYFVSKPVLQKFQKQLKAADHIACKGLETLQGIGPSFSNQRKKLCRHTRTIYDDTIESGLKKYEVVKHIGTSKVVQLTDQGTEKFVEFLASPYGEVCELTLDLLFDAVALYIDCYLPPLGDERPEKLFGDRDKQLPWKRAELLKKRFKERLYKHSLLKIQTFRLRTKTFIAKIYRFNVHEFLVEVYNTVPVLLFATIFHFLSSIEELFNYLISLFSPHQKDDNMV